MAAIIWSFSIDLAEADYLERLMVPSRNGRASLDIENNRDLNDADDQAGSDFKDHEPWQLEAMTFRMSPTPILRIDDAGFNLDYIFMRFHFASANFRSVMSSETEAVEYKSVDLSRCPPKVQAMDYRAFMPRIVANPWDPERNPGRVRSVRQEDGSLKDEWVPDVILPSDNRIGKPDLFRLNFVPPAPLFRIYPGGIWPLATDECAERILRSGVRGIGFRAANNEDLAREPMFKEIHQ